MENEIAKYPHVCFGGDYCYWCGDDMCFVDMSKNCEGRLRIIPRTVLLEKILAFGCDKEAKGGAACDEWCLGAQCTVAFKED